jgi:hypothetical protein
MTRVSRRPSRSELIFKALCVLDQAIDDCTPTPVKPNPGLRLALGLLFVFSDGDRSSFDAFWKIVIDAADAITHAMKADTRSTYARTYLTAICRSVDMPLTVDLMLSLRRARGQPTHDRTWTPYALSPKDQAGDRVEAARKAGDH